MFEDLKGKTALIIGAGKKDGIGYAISEKLASCGTNIIIADLGQLAAEKTDVATGTTQEMEDIANGLASEFDVQTLAVDVDVTNTDSIARMVEKIKKQFKTVDILCNNAGASFGVPSATHEYDEGAWLKTVDLNLHGVFRVTKAVVPMMIEKGGSIINTSSKAGKAPPLFNGAYAVSKAGVSMLTKVLATELAGSKIRANAICPGVIQSGLTDWRFDLEAQFFGTTSEERIQEMCKTIPLGRLGTQADVGSLVTFLASDESSYITGQAINITGGQLMEL
ncbi:MAG: SDR family oxidoreductase [Deltaproteobacteria bacterium]|nr:SDR family oxidoreductase [Deltaproteobacteria bacterium]